MNIRFLETFVWLAKLKSLRLTADKLHATHAAVSSRINSLEEAVGSRLFDRHAKEMVLTAAGHTVLSYAERIVTIEAQMRVLVDNGQFVRRVVRVGTSEALLHTWFSELLTAAYDGDRQLEVRIVSDVCTQLAHMLRADSLDVILHVERPLANDFVNLPLCDLPLAWVASPRLRLGGRPLSLPMLNGSQWVGATRFTRLYDVLERALATDLDPMPAIHSVHSVLGMLRLIVEGFGIGILPLSLIRSELADGRLEQLSICVAGSDSVLAELPPLTAYASYRKQSDAATVAFAELAVATARMHGLPASLAMA